MINPTQYYRPKTIDEALQYINEAGSIAFSGGGLLLGGVTLPYRSVVDLQDLAELKRLSIDGDTLRLGAGVSLEALIESDELSVELKQSLRRSLSPNLRNGVSLGESLMQPDVLTEWITALVALSAEVSHYGFRKGTFSAQAQHLDLLEFLSKVSASGETYAGIVAGLSLPVLRGRAYLGQAELARTPADMPIVNAAVMIQVDEAASISAVKAVVAGASAELVQVCDLSAMLGQPLNALTIEHAVKAIAGQVKPVADYRGSVGYRREMAALMLRRALEDCQQQLQR